ncbi:hypothetical protein [Herbidospora sp. NBRC 101105]|uniref:hypothetical protein n=1 Tax=Herbidospora sp. NBRC 101105 TaxID=3032195 RepID=UPI0024A100B4|nr:hypothetical protein [Herbidospora sp. NBRC 101105]GLX99496.1 hypothetical protein Hesp01_74460 [Herbidospora sp. NBRC 101105]
MLSTTQHRDQLGRALTRAAQLASVIPQGPPVWGRRDRTVGVPVRPADPSADLAWLRVAPFRARDVGGKGWTGMTDAEALIPPSVPRPRALGHYSWSQRGDDEPVYLATLMTHVTSPACASTDMLRDDLDVDLDRVLGLPDGWWTSLRPSLSTLATVRTDRAVISQNYLDRALLSYLQAPGLDTTPCGRRKAVGSARTPPPTTPARRE